MCRNWDKGGNPNVSSAVQAVVGIVTPGGSTPGTITGRIERFGLTEDNVRMLSPCSRISTSSAPLFLIHGTADETVPPLSSQVMYGKYNKVGVYVELKWILD